MNKLVKDLNTMSIPDLSKKVFSLEEEYFRLRCENKIGKLTNKSTLKKTRRDIARAKTISKLRNLTVKE